MVYPGNSQPVLSTQQLFGPLLPRVQITRVTLENDNRGTEAGRNLAEMLYDKNPHIDVSSATNFNLNTRRGRAEASEQLGGDQDTKVSVDLEIRVPYIQSGIPAVLDSDSVRQALSVYVAWTEERAPFNIVFNESLLRLDNNTSWITPSPISFADFTEPSRGTNEDGQQVKIYSLTWTFILQGGIDSLGIVAYSYLDPTRLTLPNGNTLNVDQTLQDFNLNLAGAPNFLWVMEHGSPVSTIPSKDENNQIQNEPVHRVQDFRIAKQIEFLDFDFALTENDKFPNLKKDLRKQQIGVNPANSSFSDIFLSRDINNYCRFFFSINWKKIILENSLFGKLFKEAQGRDLYALINKTSIKSLKIFRERVEGSAEIGSTPYKKITPPTLPDPVRPPTLFNNNAIPTLIAMGNDEPLPQYGSAPVNFRDHGTWMPNEEFIGGSIEEKSLFDSSQAGNIDPHVRNFTGADGFVSKETDGYFKYRVEIECFDKSIELIDAKYSRLQQLLAELKVYYNDATKLDQTTATPPDYSPYINRQNEIELTRGPGNPGSWNPKTKRFTRAFIEKWTRNQGAIGAGDSLVSDIENSITGVHGFVEMLEFFSNKTRKTSEDTSIEIWTSTYRTQLQNALLDYLNPYSATPESIGRVLELMEMVSSKIETILGVVYPQEYGVSNIPTQERANTPRHVAAKNRTFIVKKESTSFFNANLQQNLGFDFLNTTHENAPWRLTDTSLGLYELPSTHITEQANFERDKFFLPPRTTNFDGSINDMTLPIIGTVTSPRIPIDVGATHGSYFTPHVIVLPTGRIRTVPAAASWDTIQTSPRTIEAGSILNFLNPLSYSLCKKKLATSGAWLIAILDELQGHLPIGSRIINDFSSRMSLVNDLAAYFALNHDTIIMSPENNVLWNDRARFTGRIYPKDAGGQVHRMSRAYDHVARSGMYGAFMEMLETIMFNPVEENEIPEFHTNKRDNWSVFYDIMNPTSEIRLSLENRGGNVVTTGANDTALAILDGFLINAPIQVKGLIWRETAAPTTFSLGYAFERAVTLTPDAQNFDGDPCYQYTTQIINKVEALVGYELNEDGTDILVNKPIWKLLKQPGHGNDVLADRAVHGEPLLCRSVSCVNEEYLIERNKNYDLPTYDEYFIMTG